MNPYWSLNHWLSVRVLRFLAARHISESRKLLDEQVDTGKSLNCKFTSLSVLLKERVLEIELLVERRPLNLLLILPIEREKFNQR